MGSGVVDQLDFRIHADFADWRCSISSGEANATCGQVQKLDSHHTILRVCGVSFVILLTFVWKMRPLEQTASTRRLLQVWPGQSATAPAGPFSLERIVLTLTRILF